MIVAKASGPVDDKSNPSSSIDDCNISTQPTKHSPMAYALVGTIMPKSSISTSIEDMEYANIP
jgi:hypothetical protein